MFLVTVDCITEGRPTMATASDSSTPREPITAMYEKLTNTYNTVVTETPMTIDSGRFLRKVIYHKRIDEQNKPC